MAQSVFRIEALTPLRLISDTVAGFKQASDSVKMTVRQEVQRVGADVDAAQRLVRHASGDVFVISGMRSPPV